jgi:hypothetical protein
MCIDWYHEMQCPSYACVLMARACLRSSILFNDLLHQIDVGTFHVDDPLLLVEEAPELLGQNVTLEVKPGLAVEGLGDRLGELGRMRSGEDDLNRRRGAGSDLAVHESEKPTAPTFAQQDAGRRRGLLPCADQRCKMACGRGSDESLPTSIFSFSNCAV